MTSMTQTLCAIEARSERAIVQELRLMAQEILAMRTALVLQERSYADALLMKLDRLASDQMVAPVSAAEVPMALTPVLHFGGEHAAQPGTYMALFYGDAHGEPQDVVALDHFDCAVQLVIDRLDTHGDHVVEACWNQGQGSMKVATLGGSLLASVVAVPASADMVVHPAVAKACRALQTGDASRIDHLFGLALMAA
ncbi:MAG: hypothetical protein KBF63_18250 [Rhodoferax sp.]|nr:hypothetical protein [Rhodoferax sp.]